MRTPFNPLNPQSVSLIASYTLQAYIGAVFTFIELEPFARAREALLDDSELSKLQLHLMTRPEAGDVIPGAEGCRKMRWSLAGRGKRGGARVIYFLRLMSGEIVLVTMYAKNVSDNIDPKVLRELRRQYEKTRDT